MTGSSHNTVDQAPVTVRLEKEDVADTAAAVNRLEDFEHDWYIRVKFQIRDVKRVDKVSEITKIEGQVASLFEGLQTTLPEHDIKLWPIRLIDAADNQSDQIFTCYWVLGLPTIPSSDLAISKQHLRDWQSVSSGDIQAKFIPRKIFFKQTLLPAEDEELPKESRRSGITFKKIPGSNPHQIRRQFLQHVMGSDGSEGQTSEQSTKLRPAKEILKKLKHDLAFDANDYVVGYIDRKAGILEQPVMAWESFQQEDVVAYFRQVSEDRIIWDRAKKIDRLTAALLY